MRRPRHRIGVRHFHCFAVLDADLRGHEAQHRGGNDLTRLDQATGIAEGTELESEAQPVRRALPPVDYRHVRIAQGAMHDDICFAVG